MFCSAMPTLIVRSGQRLRKPDKLRRADAVVDDDDDARVLLGDRFERAGEGVAAVEQTRRCGSFGAHVRLNSFIAWSSWALVGTP